jgi:RNA polymerase sigma-70 factor (ECF subfamily)
MSLSLQAQYDKIYRYCYFKVRNVEIAEDLTQETFLKYFSQSTYINRGKSLAYLYIIAKNKCIDYFRRVKPEQLNEEVPAQDTISPFLTSHVVSETIARLTKEQQELILLRFANDLRMNEIAGIMKISRFAVNRKLKSTLSELKQKLKKEDFYE